MDVEQNITELKEEVAEVSSKEVERAISSEKVETKVAMAELKALEEEERAGEEDRYMLGSDNNEVKLDLLSGCVFMYLQ